MESPETERPQRRFLLEAICVAVVIAYFLHFALPALRGGFREDEMMNIGICWQAGAFKSLLANVVFWKLFHFAGAAIYDLPLYLYRPGGALYYLPLYHFSGLDPLPYRITQISILVASIPLVYYLGRRLSSSRSIAFLAVLAVCYRPRLFGLAFVGAFIYDVLCGFFYFAALAYYVRIREKELDLRPLQILGFLALYVMALNCKEMAISLPVIVLLYEVFKSHGWPDWKAFLRWVRFYAAPSLIAGLLTVFYVYGKTHGSGSLASLDPYRPKYSFANFIASNTRFVEELLFTGHAITPITLIFLWATVFVYAFVRRDRMLKLMACWIVVVPLPLAFIVPIRGDATLYLLLFGWAMIFAKLAVDLITLISNPSLFGGNRLSAKRGTVRENFSDKAYSGTVFTVATVLVALAIAAFTQSENQRLKVSSLSIGSNTSHVIQTLRSIGLRPKPDSRILLLMKEKIFQNKWNVFFIACLVWNDHSLRFWVERASEFGPQQQTYADYIISVDEFQAAVLRSPDPSKPE
jgi:hypothetical protein